MPSVIFCGSVFTGDDAGAAGGGPETDNSFAAVTVWLNVADVEVERRMPGLCLHDAGRKLDAAVVLVAGEHNPDRHITEDVVRDPVSMLSTRF